MKTKYFIILLFTLLSTIVYSSNVDTLRYPFKSLCIYGHAGILYSTIDAAFIGRPREANNKIGYQIGLTGEHQINKNWAFTIDVTASNYRSGAGEYTRIYKGRYYQVNSWIDTQFIRTITTDFDFYRIIVTPKLKFMFSRKLGMYVSVGVSYFKDIINNSKNNIDAIEYGYVTNPEVGNPFAWDFRPYSGPPRQRSYSEPYRRGREINWAGQFSLGKQIWLKNRHVLQIELGYNYLQRESARKNRFNSLYLDFGYSLCKMDERIYIPKSERSYWGSY